MEVGVKDEWRKKRKGDVGGKRERVGELLHTLPIIPLSAYRPASVLGSRFSVTKINLKINMLCLEQKNGRQTNNHKSSLVNLGPIINPNHLF